MVVDQMAVSGEVVLAAACLDVLAFALALHAIAIATNSILLASETSPQEQIPFAGCQHHQLL